MAPTGMARGYAQKEVPKSRSVLLRAQKNKRTLNVEGGRKRRAQKEKDEKSQRGDE